jgi:hypothetical protein
VRGREGGGRCLVFRCGGRLVWRGRLLEASAKEAEKTVRQERTAEEG